MGWEEEWMMEVGMMMMTMMMHDGDMMATMMAL